MKKTLSVLLILCLALGILASCSAKEADYTLSIGVAVVGDTEGTSVSVTTAAVVLDADGKVVLCRLDANELAAAAENGAVISAVTEKSKYEKGDAYGMVAYGDAKAEWFKQAEFFEEYVVGKTADEIANIKTGDAELVAGCTIDVADFVLAITNAIKLERKVSFTSTADMTLGVALTGKVADASGNAEYTFDTAATVMVDGKVVAAIADCAESTLMMTEYAFDYKGTKLELGDSYGMVAYGDASAEWYTQAQTFADTAVGKTADEVAELPVENVAGCTMSVHALQAILARAAKNVR